ncbi:hypothetical protein [Deinococcus sp. UR1]|uniref:hypothetical protein n=1 Tax=Deinococcus sp. UR1 TaxID=1704277 RepID=UPI000C1A7988|nr:hypothetical protein [Deinococcus sp. UR1]PIG96895.1 hypothetical protein AMD26_015315 [Deinococcus sp. UR1]
MTTEPPYMSMIAPAVYQAMRAAGHPCPSGDGYPTHALNIYRHLSLFTKARTHEEGVTHLTYALALALDLAEGNDPGGFYATAEARFIEAITLDGLRAAHGIERVHTLMAACTELWHALPQGQDSNIRFIGYVSEVAVCLCATLRIHGANPDNILPAINFSNVMLPGRPA